MKVYRFATTLTAVSLAVAGSLPAAAARSAADTDPHVTGTGAVPDTIAGCVTAMDLHATALGHPGQHLDLWTTCPGTATEVHVEGSPECIAQEGSVAYLAYVDEGIRLVVSDGGVGADEVAVAYGEFKKATPANKCRGGALVVGPAAGEFVVGLP